MCDNVIYTMKKGLVLDTKTRKILPRSPLVYARMYRGRCDQRWWWQVTARGQAKVLTVGQFLDFQHPGKLNNTSKTWIILLKICRNWKLTCRSIIMIKKPENKLLNIYFEPSKLALFGAVKRKFLIFQLSGKWNNIRKAGSIQPEICWKWKLTCSSIIKIKKWIKTIPCIFFWAIEFGLVSGCHKKISSWFSNPREREIKYIKHEQFSLKVVHNENWHNALWQN